MNLRPTIVTILSALILISLSAALPISSTIVEEQTSIGLVRKGVDSILPAEQPAKLRVLVEGPERLKEPMRVWVKRQSSIEIVDDPLAPLMVLAVKIDGSNMVVTGTLAEKKFGQNARLGDWTALVPPLVAVVLAIGLRQVVLALFLAVWLGCSVLAGGNPLAGLWSLLSGYLVPVLTDSFNLEILGFTFGLVGMVTVIGRMGGTLGLVNILSRFAKSPRSAQVVTATMGTAVFFDDYANTVVVGTTARGLTDRMRISREKLAYIVDSTSAPIAGVAVISTWIGYEVGLFDSILTEFRHIEGLPSSGYGLFFEILPLRFYCFFTLILVFLSSMLKRDIGPMLKAERRVRGGGPVSPAGDDATEEMHALEKPGVPARWYNAVIPVASVLIFILFRILAVGGDAAEPGLSGFSLDYWRAVFTRASDDISMILFTASLLGSALAIGLAVSQKLLTPKEALTSYGGGLRSLMEAGSILVLAWVTKGLCDDLGTGLALVGLIGNSLSVLFLPLVVFLLSGAIAFSTGTSWGTMALVLPVAAPLSVILSGDPLVFMVCMGAVLDGAIWGDHCSPISDTTVLSSTACGCPHVAHVKTQLSYALVSMGAAGLAGYLGYSAGWPIAASYAVGTLMMFGVLLIFGDNPDDPQTF
ncbi:MAG: Na+/H+ antiporter NhaC family protein [Deltaproteobacteria bacterium]|nr:Na+/H+ antiporter NhaC family protein [Deltaproteobacteria bacterium]